MNAGLAQARVDHPYSCKILDLGLNVNMERRIFSVYHMLETLDKDVGQDIKERKRDQRTPREDEIKTLLSQTAQALAYAHSKQIAHRDLKPNNIFMDQEGVFKVGDFGSYFEKSMAPSLAGTIAYMSSQQRQIICGEAEDYDAIKSDVFSLGVTTLAFASVAQLVKPWPLATLSKTVEATLQRVSCSEPLKDLIRSMLAFEEGARPTMQQICAALAQSPVPTPPTTMARAEAPQPAVWPQTPLVLVTDSYIKFLDFQNFTWGHPINQHPHTSRQVQYLGVIGGRASVLLWRRWYKLSLDHRSRRYSGTTAQHESGSIPPRNAGYDYCVRLWRQ